MPAPQVSKMFRRSVFQAFVLRLLVLVSVASGMLMPLPAAAQSTPAQQQELKPILDYISTAWDRLTRSITDCQSLVDPKMKVAAVLYLPAGMAEPAAVRQLSRECNVRIEHLPSEIHRLGEVDTGKIQPQGLLYLENKYVVPGGRFNEMYGWDSYFIIRGLVRGGAWSWRGAWWTTSFLRLSTTERY